MNINPADFSDLGTCDCFECQQAQVTNLELRRDPRTSAILHGYSLRRWYTAKADFEKKARAAVGKPGRQAQGCEPLGQKR